MQAMYLHGCSVHAYMRTSIHPSIRTSIHTYVHAYIHTCLSRMLGFPKPLTSMYPCAGQKPRRSTKNHDRSSCSDRDVRCAMYKVLSFAARIASLALIASFTCPFLFLVYSKLNEGLFQIGFVYRLYLLLQKKSMLVTLSFTLRREEDVHLLRPLLLRIEYFPIVFSLLMLYMCVFLCVYRHTHVL